MTDWTSQTNWTVVTYQSESRSVRTSAIESRSIPDRFAPLKGYRGWWLATEADDFALVSLGFGITWARAGIEAKCFKGHLPSIARAFKLVESVAPSDRHPVPDEDCTCGIYAVKTLSLLVEENAIASCRRLDWIQDSWSWERWICGGRSLSMNGVIGRNSPVRLNFGRIQHLLVTPTLWKQNIRYPSAPLRGRKF